MKNKIKRQLSNHYKRWFSKKALRFAIFYCSYNFYPHNNRHVAVHPGTRIAYNRIKKSGNSSILLYLKDALDKKNKWSKGEHSEQKKKALDCFLTPFDLNAKEITNLNNYIFFTIMRNPYARCLSAFLQKVAGNKDGYHNIPGYGRRNIAGFESFISFLENGGLYHNKHWWPQVDLLFLPPEQYSFIGKLEQLDTSLRSIFSLREVAIPDPLSMKEPHPSESEHLGKVTRATEKMATYYNNELYGRVYKLYCRDFELGGYEKHGRYVS